MTNTGPLQCTFEDARRVNLRQGIALKTQMFPDPFCSATEFLSRVVVFTASVVRKLTHVPFKADARSFERQRGGAQQPCVSIILDTVEHGILHPGGNGGLTPACAALAQFELFGKDPVLHFSIERRSAEAGALEHRIDPDYAVRTHWGQSLFSHLSGSVTSCPVANILRAICCRRVTLIVRAAAQQAARNTQARGAIGPPSFLVNRNATTPSTNPAGHGNEEISSRSPSLRRLAICDP